MKMQVIGVKRIYGESSKTGSDFDMCSVMCIVPVETGKTKKVTIEGHGFEVAEIDLEPAALPQFAAVKFPAQVDLQTDQVFRRGKFETVCVGLVPPLAAVGSK